MEKACLLPSTGVEAQPILNVSVVVPMYNEADTIVHHVQRLVMGCERLEKAWQLILVNDGSTDHTLAQLRTLSGHDPRITVVSYPNNRGRGFALRRGFAAAEGDVIVSTEADLSYGTAIVQQLVQALEEQGTDIAIASPYAAGGRLEGVPWKRAFFSRYGNRILSVALGSRTSTVSGMTRAYRRGVLEVLDLESDGKELHLEILSKAFALGFRSCDVPATLCWSPERRHSRSRAKTFQLLRFVASHLLFSFSELPFLLMGTVALVLLGFGLAIGGYAFYLSSQGTPVGHRPITLGAVMCILSGIQLLMFSFLAHQMRNLDRKLVRLQGDLVLFRRHLRRENG